MKSLRHHLLTSAFLLASMYLIHRACIGGSDFKVYSRAARHLMAGETPYSVIRDGTHAYKYPPWTLLFFLPFALLNEVWAGHAWLLLEGMSLFYIYFWLSRPFLSVADAPSKVRASTYVLVLLLSYGVILSHFILGQVILPLLALCLMFWVPRPFEFSSARASGLSFLLSFKLFPLWILGIDFYPTLKSLRRAVLVLLVFAGSGLMVSAWLASFRGADWQDTTWLLVKSWQETLTDGNAVLGARQLYGHTNQGLPALLYRGLSSVLSLESPQSITVWISVILTVLAVFILRQFRRSKLWHPGELWLVGLALVPVVHPLSWRHMFVFVIPLGALVLERALQSKQTLRIVLATFGLLSVGNITSDTLGLPGQFLDDLGIKSWGVLLLVGELVRNRRGEGRAVETDPFHREI